MHNGKRMEDESLFDDIASKCGLMNRLLSLGLR